MKERLLHALAQKKYLFVLYLLLAVGSGILLYTSDVTYQANSTTTFGKYNNYVIFEHSFYHLKDGLDLYARYPKEHWDLYKYTPTFAAFFGVFSLWPTGVGLCLWNVLNALLVVLAVYALPKFTPMQKGIIALCLVFETMTSIQNSQSNGLMTGLLVGAFALLENRRYFWAVFCIIFSVYIKLFGVVAIALFLLYPNKLKLALYTLLWTLVLFLVPLIFIDWSTYMQQFESFAAMLTNDHSNSIGYSVEGILKSWFGLEPSKMGLLAFGAVLFMLPYVQIKKYESMHFRMLMLVSVLIWVVIFNHKAESPTFILAMSGIAIWFMQGIKSKLNIGLFILAVVLTSLAHTDLFPPSVRNTLIKPYVLKALPSVLIWFKVLYDAFQVKGEHKSNLQPV